MCTISKIVQTNKDKTWKRFIKKVKVIRSVPFVKLYYYPTKAIK